MKTRFRTVLKVLTLPARVAVVAARALCSGPGEDVGYQAFLSDL